MGVGMFDRIILDWSLVFSLDGWIPIHAKLHHKIWNNTEKATLIVKSSVNEFLQNHGEKDVGKICVSTYWGVLKTQKVEAKYNNMKSIAGYRLHETVRHPKEPSLDLCAPQTCLFVRLLHPNKKLQR